MNPEKELKILDFNFNHASNEEISYQQENIFVKGLDPEWTNADLFEIFDQYGPIKSARVSVN